jgi:hypothetical protein
VSNSDTDSYVTISFEVGEGIDLNALNAMKHKSLLLEVQEDEY